MRDSTKNYNLRGILIIFVVLGHVLSHINTDDINFIVYTAIYTFHMPLFMILAGYYAEGCGNKSFIDNLKNGIRTLLIPYIVVNYSYLLVGHLIAGYHLRLDLFSQSTYAMWFLFVLFFYRLLVKYVTAINGYLIIWLIIFLLAPFGPARWFKYYDLFRMASFAIYFLIGYYLRTTKFDLTKLKLSTFRIGFIVIIVLIINLGLFKVFGFKLDDLYKLSYSNEYMGVGPFVVVVVRMVVISCTLLTSLVCYQLIPRRQSVITVIGKDSLTYYLSHIFLLFIFSSKLLTPVVEVESPLLGLLLSIAFTGFFIAVIYYLKRGNQHAKIYLCNIFNSAN